jgi:queuine tRNA-ribosyltransferase/7-cyano-7-deazaguanine tRNA-ribosyltransferase
MFHVLRTAKGSRARLGRLDTPHGAVETPAFVAVATRASVKGVEPRILYEIGVQMLIANAYHLHLRPGGETVAALGGLAGFSGWTGPTMTDSGGFQVFSLGAGMEHGVGKVASIFPGEHPAPRERRAQGGSLVRLSEEGVAFRSVLDGSPHVFTPESVIRLERQLGADVALVLDECTSPLHDRTYTQQAMERTHRWAERALAAFERTRGEGPNPGQLLFGIVQGGAFEDLRQESARTIGGMPFDGFAVGGSLGRSKEEMLRVLEWTLPLLPEGKARHLLGIGEIPDLFSAVRRGVDTFDCAAPTRVARNGTVYVRGVPGHRISLRNARFRNDPLPIDPSCDCPTCRSHSRAYLRHLCVTGELSYYRLATAHNLRFLVVLLQEIREAIGAGGLDDLERAWCELGQERGKGDASR